ncbi:MAG: hypothetical protein AB7E51_08850 [Pseudodesulfovibrio sp.]|jgi:hypothetical protein|uniref:Uncharacterized protein n=1 Tax=Pseudodesulfovibrio indicus TaxID=1716143 RepID=A0A126QPB8_9BACT|nr:hypothetical protein [Pseudodesulfovibrio indicus]AMK11764.1 hypothetical protein AWY79_11890 [Pseudodesulfovibrio indicus]TDT88301.1 hypothetical protein EDC59_106114 [Pseudodesulfovibrio indicus]
MDVVAPAGPVLDYQTRREEELERVSRTSRPPEPDDKPPAEVKADSVKQAEKTTLNDFQYTGKGSFIDKVF